MDDEWDEGIALEGHTAGLAALQREGLPDAEAFAEHEAEVFTLGGDDGSDTPAVMTRPFQRQGRPRPRRRAALSPGNPRRLVVVLGARSIDPCPARVEPPRRRAGR